jgi:hypothetical protein
MLSILKGPKFEQILQKARENWIEFTPTKEEVITAGIDSSFIIKKVLRMNHF